VGLGRESNFVGVNSYQQKYVGRASSRATHSERRAIGLRSSSCIARSARAEMSADDAVIRQHGGAARLIRIGERRALRVRQTRADKNAPAPVHQSIVRF
jgi:hypothetical protein